MHRKGFDEETIETLLGKLDRAGLVNDAEFAEVWVKSRHANQGLSRTALVAELRRKGVDDEVASRRRAKSTASPRNRGPASWSANVWAPSATSTSRQRMRRLLGFLARKGYPQGLAYTVIKDELREYGAESTLLDDAVIE